MYKIKQIEGGAVFTVSAAPVLVGGIWECGDQRFTDPSGTEYEVIEATAPFIDKRITRLAFRKRFTQEEKVSIEMAALDDPTATLDQRKQSAALRVSMKDADNAEHVDLVRPDTREDVLGLELAGLIGPGRAYEILDAQIQDIERPE
jgi:hypothetical protein